MSMSFKLHQSIKLYLYSIFGAGSCSSKCFTDELPASNKTEQMWKQFGKQFKTNAHETFFFKCNKYEIIKTNKNGFKLIKKKERNYTNVFRD